MRRERDLTFDERATWGICSVCDAPDGEPCRAEVGLNLGMTASGRRLETGEGAHLARLSVAPVRVATMDVRELEIAGASAVASVLGEAFNSGDGVYCPWPTSPSSSSGSRRSCSATMPITAQWRRK